MLRKSLQVTTQKEWQPTLPSLFQQQKYGLKQPKKHRLLCVFVLFLCTAYRKLYTLVKLLILLDN